MAKALLIFLFSICISGAYAQIDKEFWFAVPEATSAHGDRPVSLRISALDRKATITIDVPASPSSMTPIVLNLNANTSQSVDLTKYINLLECRATNAVVNNGLRIRSTEFISVYYEIANYWNTDIFSLKGRNGLGKHFLTPFQTVYGIGTYNPDAFSSIDIVATEDNTIVTIVPTKNLTGSKMRTVTIKLNRGQTYSVSAEGKAGNQHLSGTVVKSSKPIAVTIKDDSVRGSPCLDMVGDQLVPVDRVGSEYIVMKGHLSSDEYFFILATENNTAVTIKTGTGTFNRSLDAGEALEWRMVGSSYYVTSSKPVYVFHLSGFGCEMGGALIPPLECSGAKEVSFVRSSSESLFLNIVVQNGDEDEFEFNGSSSIIKASDFNSVPGTSDWKYVQIEILSTDLAQGNLGKVINKKSRFQLGVINGGPRSGTKYGYFSPFSSLNLGDSVKLCRGQTANLDAGYGFDTVLWSNNSSNSQINVSKPGTYYVRAATTNGCVLYDTVTVVKPTPPKIVVNDSTQCLVGNNFRFEVVDFKSTSEYYWNLDASLKEGRNFNYKYRNAGKSTLVLQVRDDDGCLDSVTMEVEAYPNPDARFTTSKSVACEGQALEFKEATSTSSGFSFDWDFGDGSTSKDAEPTHTFSKPGRYKVLFKATSPEGCPDTLSRFIETAEKPKANFSWKANSMCENENLINFSNLSSADGSFSSVWSLGDGTASVTSSPKHSYKAGRYEIRLLVQSNKGCLDTVFDSIAISPSPLAGFSINDAEQCEDVNEFVFTQTSTLSKGAFASHEWSLGDGSAATGNQVTKTYVNQLDLLLVTLISTSKDNCADTLILPIEIDPVPKAQFSVNQLDDCLSGNQFDFTNQSSVTNRNLKYTWDFGDKNTSSSEDPSHQYKEADTFQVRLVAYDDCFDTVERQIVVHPQPESRFAANDTVQCLQTNGFRFQNQSSIPYGTLQHDWEFGNGQSASGEDSKLRYSNYGFYKVKLLSTSNFSCKDSHFLYVHVKPEPVADFNINADQQCFNEQLFTYNSTASIDSGSLTLLWDYGNAKGGLGTSVKHRYSDTGTYYVIHTAVSESGCVDSLVLPITVYPSPLARFDINDTAQCINVNRFLMTNRSSIWSGNMNYEWDMGDGNTLNSVNPSYSYSLSDTFWIKLKASSDKGCEHEDSSQVIVWEKPFIRFYLNDTQQCLENNYLISYNTSRAFQDNINYRWNLGDGTLSLDEAPEHRYTSAGVFTVWLKGVTNTGCTDSFSRNITIHPQPAPNAGFSLESDSAQCLKENIFELRNFSSIPSGKLKLIWKPDDGRIIEDSTLTLQYSYADTFSFRLIAESDFGCKDSMERALYVWPQADLKLDYSQPICEGDSFVIFNSSSIQWGSATYAMDPGNGAVSSDSSRYMHPTWGQHTASITSVSNYGCRDTLVDTFLVNPKTDVRFKIDRHYNRAVSLRNASSIDRGNYSWQVNWGDDSIDSNGNILHTYDSRGIYNVVLNTLSDSGCFVGDTVAVQMGRNFPSLHVVSRFVDTTLKGMQVSWLPDDRAVSYSLLRKGPDEAGFNTPASGLNTLLYEDWDATHDTLIYEYALVGTDSLGQESDTSLLGRNIVLQQSQYLTVRKAQLSWTPYGEHWPKTDSHLVYRYASTGPVRIGSTKGRQLSYTDSAEQILPSQCYRVVAIGPNGAESYSNVLCNDFAFYVPNAFSPNGDGVNDVFKYVVNGIHDFDLSIYARNGQRVFHTKDKDQYWTGDMNGVMATADMYRWIIKGKNTTDGEQEELVFSGQVYVIR